MFFDNENEYQCKVKWFTNAFCAGKLKTTFKVIDEINLLAKGKASSNNKFVKVEKMKNKKENETSKLITIGTQKWMSKNLDIDRFRNGDLIPEVKSIDELEEAANQNKPVCCYLHYNPEYRGIYGKLYNWFAVIDPRGLAPIGYHIPSDQEWTELTSFLGGEEIAGGKLKEVGINHWKSPNKGATNEVGFTLLPSGGVSCAIGCDADIWTSSEINKYEAWYRFVDYKFEYIYRNSKNKAYACSVRCIFD